MSKQFHALQSLFPETTGTLSIGSNELEWLEGFFQNLTVTTRATVPTPINTTDAVTKAYVDALFNPTIATMEEADGSPSITNPTTIRVDQADGLVLTEPSTGVARLDLAAIPNSVLSNSSITITTGTGLDGGGAVSLGGTVTLDLTTPVAVGDGGTGLASGTSGGILGYTAAGVLASSVALTANALVIGGGAGATPTPMTGTSGGVPYFNAATTVASSGALTANAIVLGGGAGAAPTPMTGTSGGVPYFNAATTVASSGLLVANAVVKGGGAGAAPASLTDPGADRLIFWDESANDTVYATIGSGLTMTDTTLTASSGPSAASQAEMEAASSTTVYASPGTTKYHPGVAKFFSHHDSSGSNIVSYNVTSVSDTGTGDHTVNLTTAFSASQTGAIVTGLEDSAGQACYARSTGTTTIRLTIRDTDAAYALEDPPGGNWQVAGFGDQA